MSSEQLADGVNPLDAELAATWDVLKGYSGRDTDLGIARRFGAAAACVLIARRWCNEWFCSQSP